MNRSRTAVKVFGGLVATALLFLSTVAPADAARPSDGDRVTMKKDTGWDIP